MSEKYIQGKIIWVWNSWEFKITKFEIARFYYTWVMSLRWILLFSLCWGFNEFVSVFLRITTNQGSIPSEECDWLISHWMITWYFKERLHGIVYPPTVLVDLCLHVICFEVFLFYIIMWSTRNYNNYLSARITDLWWYLKPHFKLLANGNVRQLSPGFTLLLLTVTFHMLYFSQTHVHLNCWLLTLRFVRVLVYKRGNKGNSICNLWVLFSNLSGQVVSLVQMIPLVM